MLELALSGHVSFIETVRNVNRMVEAAGFDRFSEPFITLMGIDSETDEIPLGKVRYIGIIHGGPAGENLCSAESVNQLYEAQ